MKVMYWGRLALIPLFWMSRYCFCLRLENAKLIIFSFPALDIIYPGELTDTAFYIDFIHTQYFSLCISLHFILAFRCSKVFYLTVRASYLLLNLFGLVFLQKLVRRYLFVCSYSSLKNWVSPLKCRLSSSESNCCTFMYLLTK